MNSFEMALISAMVMKNAQGKVGRRKRELGKAYKYCGTRLPGKSMLFGRPKQTGAPVLYSY